MATHEVKMSPIRKRRRTITDAVTLLTSTTRGENKRSSAVGIMLRTSSTRKFSTLRSLVRCPKQSNSGLEEYEEAAAYGRVGFIKHM